MTAGAIEGLNVLDLTWVVVGPSAVRVLADLGATVVKVETGTRVDTARTAGPFLDGRPGPESSACFNNFNAGKYGLLLNLARPEAKSVLDRLLAWADVLAENFTPRVMRRWGLDFEAVRAVNPRIIYLSASMAGQEGPLANLAAIGNVGAAVAGHTNVVGWPDRPPAGPGGAYTDYVAARYITIAILAALEHRDRTGEGQYIDLAQAETAIHFLGPAYLDYQASGRVPAPVGHQSFECYPQGVFPCAGNDQWIAIAVQESAQWWRLAHLIGRADLADRLPIGQTGHSEDETIRAAIGAWTQARGALEAEALLITHGIPAHAALDSVMAVADPQLNHRGHFVSVPHETWGSVTVENTRFQLSRTPSQVRAGGPTFGQHAGFVLGSLLGMQEEELAELAAAGVFE